MKHGFVTSAGALQRTWSMPCALALLSPAPESTGGNSCSTTMCLIQQPSDTNLANLVHWFCSVDADRQRSLAILAMVLAVCCAFLFGFWSGGGMRASIASRIVAPQIEPGTQTTMKYQLVKAQLNARTVPELTSLFARVMGFSPGRATKMTLVLAMVAEHDFEPIELQSRPIDQVVAHRGGRGNLAA